MKRRLAIAFAIAVLAVPVFAGSRRAAAGGSGPAQMVAGAVELPVFVDLTGVESAGRPAVLAAYVARVEFDRDAVEFLRADGGNSSGFSGAPVSTMAEIANEKGVVRLVAYQTNLAGPSGRVSVANVMFREKVPGGASSIHVVLESAARALTEGRETKNLALPVHGAETE